MEFQISELQFPERIENDYESEFWAKNRLHNLSRLNVFIGPNNSGKSRLLRELFADESLNYVPNLKVFNEVQDALIKLINYLELKNPNERIVEAISQIRTPTLNISDQRKSDVNNIKSRLTHLEQELRKQHYKDFNQAQIYINKIKRNFQEIQRAQSIEAPKRIYIPSLRGLRAPDGHREFYRKRTVSDYFKRLKRLNKSKNGLSEYEIITGLELYEEVKNHLLGSLDQRQKIADYQTFLSKRFFKGKKVVLIPRVNSDVLYVKVGQEEEQPIYELGDGIQHIIILTIPMFFHRDKPLLMFVEEPELFLHHGFQRLFIETVLEDTSDVNRQVFVATHSSQFLDITIEEDSISTYKFKKLIPENVESKSTVLPKFSITNTSNDDFSILSELGIRNSSIMLANCTIWVEGITDRLYLRKYLEVYQEGMNQKYIEDLHYSFVEYGGANIVHWSFDKMNSQNIYAKRISNNILLIRDQDGKGITATDKELKQSLGDNYCKLTSREIENLLSADILVKVIRDYEGEDKELNDFTKSQYSKEYLGTFIENEILAGNHSKKYSAKSGTIRDKVNFAHKAISHIKEEKDLSKEAVNLTRRVFEFIETHNS